MNHLCDWIFREIRGQLLRGIEFIAVGDFLARANLPKCVSEVPTGKEIPELQNVLHRYISVIAGTLCGRVHLPDSEFMGGDVAEDHHLLDFILQVIDGFQRCNFSQNGVPHRRVRESSS